MSCKWHGVKSPEQRCNLAIVLRYKCHRLKLTVGIRSNLHDQYIDIDSGVAVSWSMCSSLYAWQEDASSPLKADRAV